MHTQMREPVPDTDSYPYKFGYLSSVTTDTAHLLTHILNDPNLHPLNTYTRSRLTDMHDRIVNALNTTKGWTT